MLRDGSPRRQAASSGRPGLGQLPRRSGRRPARLRRRHLSAPRAGRLAGGTRRYRRAGSRPRRRRQRRGCPVPPRLPHGVGLCDHHPQHRNESGPDPRECGALAVGNVELAVNALVTASVVPEPGTALLLGLGLAGLATCGRRA
ncbi:PEP-CTERM sorting domain-containing protein [Myxococcota bacterium]|nr:PEP-CTERM sorting domain-containing protein [Myxococcota bacterium]